jgi:flagellar biosynthetic protein FlhB
VAENDRQDRTEEATAKRREDARRKGQVPRSVELSAASVLLAAGATLYLAAGPLGGALAATMRRGLSFDARLLADEGAAIAAFRSSMIDALLACFPLLGMTLLAALVAPAMIGGWNFSAEALGFRGGRISPLAGLQRMFSLRSLVELGKSLAKFGLVAGAAVTVLTLQYAEIQQLGRTSVEEGIRGSLALSGQALLAMAAAIGVIAALDAPYQVWQHAQDLRMTRQELRDESKETEGSPEVRGRIRSAQQAMARRRMMADVPGADVVVTNPTHYSVALRYDERSMRAPVVVAKGAGVIAARIREVAAEHGVPLVEAPPLARVLYRSVEIGMEVPTALYAAVAQILTYVFQLRTSVERGTRPPEPPAIDPAVEHCAGDGER